VFDNWRDAKDEEADLDLIPVMNLFMVLIPFLLLGAAFVHMSVIPTSTPTRKDSPSQKKKKKDEEPTSVMAQLALSPGEMNLTFSGAGIPSEKLDELGASWSIDGEDYPVDELRDKLRAAKDQYPDSNTVTVVPHEDFQYQELVEVLDATREEKVGTDDSGDPTFEPLFPVTVFSKFPPPVDPEKHDGGGEGGQ